MLGVSCQRAEVARLEQFRPHKHDEQKHQRAHGQRDLWSQTPRYACGRLAVKNQPPLHAHHTHTRQTRTHRTELVLPTLNPKPENPKSFWGPGKEAHGPAPIRGRTRVHARRHAQPR